MDQSQKSKWDDLRKNGDGGDASGLKGLITRLDKKLRQTIKVIQNPDQFNVNISSRERLERLEHRVKDLEEMLWKGREQELERRQDKVGVRGLSSQQDKAKDSKRSTEDKGGETSFDMGISPALQKLLDEKRRGKK